MVECFSPLTGIPLCRTAEYPKTAERLDRLFQSPDGDSSLPDKGFWFASAPNGFTFQSPDGDSSLPDGLTDAVYNKAVRNVSVP